MASKKALQRSAPERRPWRGDSWSRWIGIIIEGRLRPHRERIAELLSIDPNDKEWQNEPAAMSDDPELSPGERYLRWRGTPPPGGGFVSRVDLAIEDITGELRRCWAIFRNVNRAGSPAAVYRALEELEANSEDLVARLEEASPYVQVLVAGKCPDGWLALENDEVDPEQLRAAISKAKSALHRPARGRPKGTRDFASQHLAQALADIYLRHSVKRPTRRRLSLPDEPRKYGPYKDFVELIASIIPARLRSSKKGGLKGVDHLVRIGVEHIRDRAASST